MNASRPGPGTSDRLQRTGWLKAYRTEAAFAGAALEREILAGHGVVFDILDTAALRDLEPAVVRPYAKAMLLTETGSVREPGRLIEACEALFSGLGGRRLRGSVARLAPDSGGWRIDLESGAVRARQVVLAAGAASGAIARPLGYRFAVAAERGYHRHYALHPGKPAADPAGARYGRRLDPLADERSPGARAVGRGTQREPRRAGLIPRSRQPPRKRPGPCGWAGPSTMRRGSAPVPRRRTECP